MSFDPSRDWPLADVSLDSSPLRPTVRGAVLPAQSALKDVLWVRKKMAHKYLSALVTQSGNEYTRALLASSKICDRGESRRRLAFVWVRAMMDANATGTKWTPLLSECDRWPGALARAEAVAVLSPASYDSPGWARAFQEAANSTAFRDARLSEWLGYPAGSTDNEAIWARTEQTKEDDPMRRWAWRRLPMSDARLKDGVDVFLGAKSGLEIGELLENRCLTESQIEYVANRLLEGEDDYTTVKAEGLVALALRSPRHAAVVQEWMIAAAASAGTGSFFAAEHVRRDISSMRLNESQMTLIRQALVQNPFLLCGTVLMHEDTPDDLAITTLKLCRKEKHLRGERLANMTLRSPAYQRSGAFRDWCHRHPTASLARPLLENARTIEETNRAARMLAISRPSELLAMLESGDPCVVGKVSPEVLEMINNSSSGHDRIRVALLWHTTGESQDRPDVSSKSGAVAGKGAVRR